MRWEATEREVLSRESTLTSPPRLSERSWSQRQFVCVGVSLRCRGCVCRWLPPKANYPHPASNCWPSVCQREEWGKKGMTEQQLAIEQKYGGRQKACGDGRPRGCCKNKTLRPHLVALKGKTLFRISFFQPESVSFIFKSLTIGKLQLQDDLVALICVLWTVFTVQNKPICCFLLLLNCSSHPNSTSGGILLSMTFGIYAEVIWNQAGTHFKILY